MILRSRLITATTAAILLLTGCSGCAIKSATVLTPTQQVSFTLNQTLSVVAAINKSLATDVIGLSNSGLISKPLTNSVLTWQRVVATQIIVAESIQQSTMTDAQKAAAIRAAFAQMPLPADVAALLSAPQTSQAVMALITTIQSLVSLIVSVTGGA